MPDYSINISRRSIANAMSFRCDENLETILLHIFCRCCQWKNFDNWSIFAGEDMDKRL